MTGPYGQAADAYWGAGWRGVLPLPPRAKKSPPTGYTGERGDWPSYADTYTWASGPEGDGNIALRMSHNIIGVDVDCYGTKHGEATVQEAEARWGALPPTWRSTSRDDGISGIRLYRIPEGLAWPGELGADVELIQWRHRYTVVWPSIHPDTGGTYRWITPEGVTSTSIPDPDLLAPLPDAWVAGLTRGEMATATNRNAYSGTETSAWVVARPGALAEPCARMARAIESCTIELQAGGSAHNAARDSALRCVRLAEEGHSGVVQALAETRRAFVAEVTNASRRGGAGMTRTKAEAEREWADLVTSAVNLVTAEPTGIETCDCDGRLTGLIVGGAFPTDGAAALTPLPAEPQPDPATAATADTAERKRTSWWPRPLDQVIAGNDPEPEPTHLARSDGACLFYAGKVNAILGESESGKTWLALLAVVQSLTQGQHVVYLDFEDTASGIVARLRSLGSTDDDLTRLYYIGPDETLHAAASDDLRETLDTIRPDLTVLDGWNAAMTLLGLDLEKNKDATRFAQLLLKPLSMTGSTVVAIDHLPKNKENRGKGGIGAQAKRAMMTGCAVLVDVITPFGRGMTGKLSVKVDKDRPGHVRAVSEGAKNVGVAVLESDSATGRVTVTLEAPTGTRGAERGPFRPTHIMGEVSGFLATCPPAGVSQRDIEKGVPRNAANVRTAIQRLVEEGYISRQPGTGSSLLHQLIRPFSADSDWVRPGASEVRPDAGQDSASGPVPPVGDGTHSATPRTSEVRPADDNTQHACKTCYRPVGAATAKATNGNCPKCHAKASA